MELNFFFLINDKDVLTFATKQLINCLFFIKELNRLNFFEFNPINSEGIIPTSDKTEYLPPIKLL